MESQNTNQGKIYLIDHQEKFLYEWSRWEYAQMIKYLSQTPSKVYITNSKLFEDYKEEEQKDLNEKMIAGLREDIKNTPNKMAFIKDSINDMVEKSTGNIEIDGKQIPLERVCLLDMKATQSLSAADGENFDVFLFGGILGDNPPRDRTSLIRRPEIKSRQLGVWQLPTDTALLMTKLIVENGVKMEEIPTIDEPEFFKKTEDGKEGDEESVTLDNFRVITEEIDPHTGKITKKENPKTLGNPNIYERLVFEELDFDFDGPLQFN